MWFSSAVFSASRTRWLQVLKTFLAINLAWLFSLLLPGVSLPVFAAITALLVVAPSLHQTVAKGIERTLGVIVGVLIGTVFSAWLGQVSGAVLAAIATGLLVGWLARASLGLMNQLAISAMLVIALGGGGFHYAVDRIIETLIGAVTGFLVNLLIVAPVHVEPARSRVADLGGEIAASLMRLADALEHRQTSQQLHGLLLEVRLMQPMVESCRKAIADARESLRFNPLGKKNRDFLDDTEVLLNDRLRPIVTEVIGMTRAFYDHYDDSLSCEPMAFDIAEQMRRSAHDVRLAVHLAEVDPAPMTSAVPALTAPLQLTAPRGQRWILIGSLMEDLRRIRDNLSSSTV